MQTGLHMCHPLLFHLRGPKQPIPTQSFSLPHPVVCNWGKATTKPEPSLCFVPVRPGRWAKQQRQRIGLHHQERERKGTKAQKEGKKKKKRIFILCSLITETTVQMHKIYANKSTECWLQHLVFTYRQPLLSKLVPLIRFSINNLFKAHIRYTLRVVLHYLYFCISLLHKLWLTKIACWYKTNGNSTS